MQKLIKREFIGKECANLFEDTRTGQLKYIFIPQEEHDSGIEPITPDGAKFLGTFSGVVKVDNPDYCNNLLQGEFTTDKNLFFVNEEGTLKEYTEEEFNSKYIWQQ